MILKLEKQMTWICFFFNKNLHHLVEKRIACFGYSDYRNGRHHNLRPGSLCSSGSDRRLGSDDEAVHTHVLDLVGGYILRFLRIRIGRQVTNLSNTVKDGTIGSHYG